MRNAGLEEAQAGIQIAGRNINNLRYADDTTLMAESEEELKSLLTKVKEESEKVGLTLNIQKTNIILCSQRWRSSVQSAKTTPGADCGSNQELLIAKFRLKLKKVGKTTRAFRYDLNQIPYDYIVEVRNRFKGLDLIDRVHDELWTEVRDIVQETGIKTITKKKKCKKQNGCLGRPYK